MILSRDFRGVSSSFRSHLAIDANNGLVISHWGFPEKIIPSLFHELVHASSKRYELINKTQKTRDDLLELIIFEELRARYYTNKFKEKWNEHYPTFYFFTEDLSLLEIYQEVLENLVLDDEKINKIIQSFIFNFNKLELAEKTRFLESKL